MYTAKTQTLPQYPQPSAPVATKKSSGGLFSSVIKAVDSSLASVSHEIDKGLTKIYINDKNADDRFRRWFNLPSNEGLLFELPVKAATVDNVIVGHLYLSYNYLSFHAEFNAQKVNVMIPLRDIIAVQRAMLGPSAKESIPNIIPYNPVENKLTDQYVIEVYTVDGRVHQFFSIVNYESYITTIQNTWKNCNKTVPPPQPLPPQQVYQPVQVTVVPPQ